MAIRSFPDWWQETVLVRLCAQHAIVSTVLTNDKGASIRITDFAPRFREYDRIFRPRQLMRIIEPIGGMPRITIRVRPTSSYGAPMALKSMGSNHVRFSGADVVVHRDHRSQVRP